MHDISLYRSAAEIDRSTLWGWLEPRAHELACAYWSGRCLLPLVDFRGLMRVHALCFIQRPCARGLAGSVKARARDIADAVFEAAVADVGAYHDRTQAMIRMAAAAAMRGGRDPNGIAAAVVKRIADRDPPLPLDMEQAALVDAARDVRIERSWARKKPGR